ncbi:MAG: hypothetical protein AAFN77_03860 [Planctomycetota bacterium]
MKGTLVKALRMVLLIVGLLAMAFSLLLFGMAMLGINGMLADVGPKENYQFGMQLLTVSGIVFAVSGAMIVVSVFLKNRFLEETLHQ